MAWAKFDDEFGDSAEADMIGPVGVCLFTCSITWAAKNLTDGFIPDGRASRLLGGEPSAIAKLLEVGWWVKADGGYQISPNAPVRIYDPRRDDWDTVRPVMAPAVYLRDEHRCVYCGSPNDLTVDHIMPVTRGGSNEMDNLATACRPCNSSKKDRTPEEWRN